MAGPRGEWQVAMNNLWLDSFGLCTVSDVFEQTLVAKTYFHIEKDDYKGQRQARRKYKAKSRLCISLRGDSLLPLIRASP